MHLINISSDKEEKLEQNLETPHRGRVKFEEVQSPPIEDHESMEDSNDQNLQKESQEEKHMENSSEEDSTEYSLEENKESMEHQTARNTRNLNEIRHEELFKLLNEIKSRLQELDGTIQTLKKDIEKKLGSCFIPNSRCVT